MDKKRMVFVIALIAFLALTAVSIALVIVGINGAVAVAFDIARLDSATDIPQEWVATLNSKLAQIISFAIILTISIIGIAVSSIKLIKKPTKN